MKILIFTEGTVLMPLSMNNLTREERVKLSKIRDSSVHDFKNHIPNQNSVEKINEWKKQDAEIYYLTSRTTVKEVNEIKNVLQKYNFPHNKNLLFRKMEEEYKDVTEHLMPDILIEDDCESIGKGEITYTHINPDKQKLIKSIIIKEFSGIDNLPDNLKELRSF